MVIISCPCIIFDEMIYVHTHVYNHLHIMFKKMCGDMNIVSKTLPLKIHCPPNSDQSSTENRVSPIVCGLSELLSCSLPMAIIWGSIFLYPSPSRQSCKKSIGGPTGEHVLFQVLWWVFWGAHSSHTLWQPNLGLIETRLSSMFICLLTLLGHLLHVYLS